jgi:surfeit locus 1 family protein
MSDRSTAPTPRRWGLWLVVLAFALCVGMAVFQLWRAHIKTQRHDQIQAAIATGTSSLNDVHAQGGDLAALTLHTLTLRGTWLPEKTIFLDNKIRRRWVGYHVLTPLQLEGSSLVVLVNRGWVLAPRLRSEMPKVVTETGVVQLTGQARPFEQRVFELAPEAASPGPVWQHVTEPRYRAGSGLAANLSVAPFLVLQQSPAADGLAREWEEPQHPALHHLGYAGMWLVFALLAVGYGWLSRSRD